MLGWLKFCRATNQIRLFGTWHGTIRAIEEFINIPLFGIKDAHLVAWLNSIRVDDLFKPDGVSLFSFD